MNNNNIDDKFLQDIKQDRKIDWKGKHIMSLKTEKSMARLKMFSRAERVSNCATWLKFAECPQINHHKKLVGASFCKDRLCPMCNWRRSRMLSKQILSILHVAQERKKMRFLFLTLTIRNVDGTELSNTITEMFKAYERLFKYKDVDKNMVGWIRNLEITHNEKENTYHPHFHVLIAVSPSYFGTGYLSQAKWSALWQKALDVDYTPTVHIEAVKPKKEGQTVEGAVSEIAKYAVKDSDYIKDNEKEMDNIIKVLATALSGRRLIGFGKLFRTIRKELKQKDIENEKTDLVNADGGECHCPICNSTLVEQLYSWDYNSLDYRKK